MASYGLHPAHLSVIRKRDTVCVYCRGLMADPKSGVSRNEWATIEHLNHLPPWNNPETVAICCYRCNSSRGQKPLLVWFKSNYCLTHTISPESVSIVVKNYLQHRKTLTKFK